MLSCIVEIDTWWWCSNWRNGRLEGMKRYIYIWYEKYLNVGYVPIWDLVNVWVCLGASSLSVEYEEKHWISNLLDENKRWRWTSQIHLHILKGAEHVGIAEKVMAVEMTDHGDDQTAWRMSPTYLPICSTEERLQERRDPISNPLQSRTTRTNRRLIQGTWLPKIRLKKNPRSSCWTSLTIVSINLWKVMRIARISKAGRSSAILGIIPKKKVSTNSICRTSSWKTLGWPAILLHTASVVSQPGQPRSSTLSHIPSLISSTFSFSIRT